MSSDAVEEFQGLYGPYHVPEHLIQKIWLRGELDLTRLRTESGRKIRIIRAGEWNLLGGPDFIGADLEINGRRLTGDLEIHFRQEDWFAHGHHLDSAYDRVVLHLVLFPPEPGTSPACTRAGDEIETASLVDLLWHDLEEYALNEAAAQVSTRAEDQVLETLLLQPLHRRRDRLALLAERRWEQKLHFARIRMERMGWEQACHSTTLEVLGYSRNRSGMLAVADRVPPEEWREPGFSPEFLLQRDDIPWQRQGIRPANQPGRRLNQYAAMCSGPASWTDRLISWNESLPKTTIEGTWPPVAALRRQWGLPRLRTDLRDRVIQGAIRGPRMDSVAVDAFLPMLAVRGNPDLFPLWFSWPVGDMPASYRFNLRQAGVAGLERDYPYAHGWFQGLLGLLLEIPEAT